MPTFKRILVAEDDPNDQELTLEALAEHNLANEVDLVKDGQEALDYLFRQGTYAGRDDGHPNVVLLDIKMPKVDGVEVLRRIKHDPVLRMVPVVILTSSRKSETCWRAIAWAPMPTWSSRWTLTSLSMRSKSWVFFGP